MNPFEDYCPRWEELLKASKEEILQLSLESLGEEDLDALAYRFIQEKNKPILLEVYEKILQGSKQNPAVEYTNLFEEVVIEAMSQKNYSKALVFLKDYEIYDQNHRKGYRRFFIRRNQGVCLILMGQKKEGQDRIEEVLKDAKDHFWNYYDLALEFYFACLPSEAVSYLERGLAQAQKQGNSTWSSFFERQIERIVSSSS